MTNRGNHIQSSLRKGREVYLDNNATTAPLPEVLEVMERAQRETFGNPSSVHRAGEKARSAVREARETVSEFIGVTPAHVLFTSGTTEANNLILQNLLLGDLKGFRLITCTTEHSSILQPASFLKARGIEVFVLPVDGSGRVDPASLREVIAPGRTLVSIQWANNETGVIQSIAELASVAKEKGALFHSDAAQAVGKVPIDLTRVPVDLLSLSGHKVHGPKGIGAIAGSGLTRLSPTVFGGSQEGSIRPGTENVPGILGLAVALRTRASRFSEANRITEELRDAFEGMLLQDGLAETINGNDVDRLPNTSSVRFSGVDGEALVVRLDQEGVRCSQSSACTNQKPEPSYVLRAMGLAEDEAYASLRFGFSEMNSAEEIRIAVEAIRRIRDSLIAFAPA